MEDSTTRAGADVAPVDLSGLWARLSALRDARHARGKRYALATVLLLVVLAKLAGEDRPSGIADWVKHRRAQLAAALERALGVADAQHTQRPLSQQIVAAGGAYLWFAKDNQPTLRADIELLFAADRRTVEGGRAPDDFRRARTVEKGHGRRELRELTASAELAGYSDWPGLAQVFRLERERHVVKTGKCERAVGYGLTSLPPTEASPARLLALARAYWGIENGLHYRRDVTFHEDATRLTQGHAGRAMAALNNLVIGLLRLAGFTNLAAARRRCAAALASILASLARTHPS
jgi:hypothetical protein